MQSEYTASLDYETFIRKCRLCRREEHDAHNQNMLNLIVVERGGPMIKGQGTEQKMLRRIKANLTSAADYAIKSKTTPLPAEKLEAIKNALASCNGSTELLQVCKDANTLIFELNT